MDAIRQPTSTDPNVLDDIEDIRRNNSYLRYEQSGCTSYEMLGNRLHVQFYDFNPGDDRTAFVEQIPDEVFEFHARGFEERWNMKGSIDFSRNYFKDLCQSNTFTTFAVFYLDGVPAGLFALHYDIGFEGIVKEIGRSIDINFSLHPGLSTERIEQLRNEKSNSIRKTVGMLDQHMLLRYGKSRPHDFFDAAEWILNLDLVKRIHEDDRFVESLWSTIKSCSEVPHDDMSFEELYDSMIKFHEGSGKSKASIVDKLLSFITSNASLRHAKQRLTNFRKLNNLPPAEDEAVVAWTIDGVDKNGRRSGNNMANLIEGMSRNAFKAVSVLALPLLLVRSQLKGGINKNLVNIMSMPFYTRILNRGNIIQTGGVEDLDPASPQAKSFILGTLSYRGIQSMTRDIRLFYALMQPWNLKYLKMASQKLKEESASDLSSIDLDILEQILN